VTGTPVAFVNAATSAMKPSSSDCTKRFQRSSWSFAPFSGFQGEACAQACANAARLAASSAPAPAIAAPALSASRRVNLRSSFMCLLLRLDRQ
jgi:hypothetical protein